MKKFFLNTIIIIFLSITFTLFPQNTVSATENTYIPPNTQNEISLNTNGSFTMPDWMKIIIVIGLFAAVIGWIYIWYKIWVKYGKEHSVSKFPGYVKYPPSDLPPAFIEPLLSQGQKLTVNSFTATILDLARRNIITIVASQTPDSYEFILRLADKEILDKSHFRSFEALIINFIFSQADDNKTIPLEKLSEIIENDPVVTKHVFDDWITKVKKETERYEFIEPVSKKWRTIFLASNSIFVFTLFIVTITIVGMKESYSIFNSILALAPVVAVINGNLFLRWNKNSKAEVLKWEGFKKYIDDFSYNKHEIPQYVAVWEDMLIYGTAFGIAKKVTKDLSHILTQPGAFSPSWYIITTKEGKVLNDHPGEDFARSLAASLSDVYESFTNTFNGTSGGGFLHANNRPFKFLPM